jgi:hypothetical protein
MMLRPGHVDACNGHALLAVLVDLQDLQTDTTATPITTPNGTASRRAVKELKTALKTRFHRRNSLLSTMPGGKFAHLIAAPPERRFANTIDIRPRSLAILCNQLGKLDGQSPLRDSFLENDHHHSGHPY